MRLGALMNKTSSNWIYKQPDLNLYRPTSLINIFPCGSRHYYTHAISILLLTHTLLN